MIGIYCIECINNNKKYIGQSVDIIDRWSKHKSSLRGGYHDNDYLQNAWNKYGEESFNFYILEECDIDKLDELEMYWIDFYNTFKDRSKGFNLVSGGSSNKKHSVEVKEKIREANIGHIVTQETRDKISENHADVNGINNPMYGKKHSDKVKQAISKANTGRKSSKRNLTPVYCVEIDRVFDDAASAAKFLSLDSSAILKCCRNERKTCGGYHFVFCEIGK